MNDRRRRRHGETNTKQWAGAKEGNAFECLAGEQLSLAVCSEEVIEMTSVQARAARTGDITNTNANISYLQI